MTAYTHRLIVVVPAAYRDLANQLAATVGYPQDVDTFTVPLLTGGAVTHYWCSTAQTEAGWAATAQLAGAIPGAFFYRLHPLSGVLLETNSPGAQGAVGLAWTPADVLADLGLSVTE